MVYTKNQAQSSQGDVSTSHGRGGIRKAPVQEATNPKRRRLIESSESDSEVDIPVARRTRDPLSSSSSSSEMESDSKFSDVEDETEDEQSGVPVQETGSKQKPGTLKPGTKPGNFFFSEEQNRLLLAAFQANHCPTKEQREKLAEKADLTRQQWHKLTEEQSSRMDDVFAVSSRPDEATIASLASELQVEKDRVRNYFKNRRSFMNRKTNAKLPPPLPLKEAEPILMDIFKENPMFKDYKNIELKNKINWGYHRICKFFTERRRENRISIGPSPLSEAEAQPILMDIFRKDPLFHDYKNVELKNKIQWKHRRVKSWFVRQRKSNQQAKLDHFKEVMEKTFQKQQYFATRSETLEVEAGASWLKILAWLIKRRRESLKAYLKKETTFLPNEMAKFERIFEKYHGRPMDFEAVRSIEQEENVCGYNFSDYLMDRQNVLAKLRKEREAVNVEQEEEEFVDEQDAHEEDQNETNLDYQMDSDQGFQSDAHHEEEDHVENRGAEKDTDEELEEEPVDQSEPNSQRSQEQDVQPVDNQEAAALEFENDDIEFDNQEAAVVEEHHGRVDGPEVHQQVSEQQVTGQEVQPAAHQEAAEDVEQEEESVDGHDAYEAYPVEQESDFEMNNEGSVHPVAHQEQAELEFENDEIGFNYPQEALVNQGLYGQMDEPVAEQIVPVNVKVEYPEPEIENFERLETPVKQEKEDVEDEEVQLLVFDVMDVGASQDVGAVGPVVIERVQASFEDIQPDYGYLIGFPEIGFASKTKMSENKKRLNLENLTLPFNCSTNYLRWSKLQMQEFFCQLLEPAMTLKLVEKVRAGVFLSMFQPDLNEFFDELNKDGVIINWNEFLMICQEIQKLKDFNKRLAR
ncbi:unnamed protein product [Caenorhabditis nigoni]|uniref:Homeobox domain-containing protein n=1 Tax=Caenorhabditis nigoni TaxID=1611254 RepID=A0A2G5V8D1_9PELO|nr:hypothetical protein B9Z55_007124 [Caenorhabditis nigoni]